MTTARTPNLAHIFTGGAALPARWLFAGALGLALPGCSAASDPTESDSEAPQTGSSGSSSDSSGTAGELPGSTGAAQPDDTTGTSGTEGTTTDDPTGGAVEQCQLADDNVACDALVGGGRLPVSARPTLLLQAEGPQQALGGPPAAAAACDVFAQDCPAGEKCNPYADDGGDFWNATGCFPLDPAPAKVGEPCSSQGTQGPDSCEAGSLCKFDPEAGFVCIALCGCSAENPTCGANEKCKVYNNGVLPVCTPLCDPFVPDSCPEGQLCAMLGDWSGDFVCFPDKSADKGALGDPCQTINGCDPGYSCEIADYVPGGCNDPAAANCCTPLCDLDAPDCPEGSHCLEYFGGFGLEAPVCLEDVGYCIRDDAARIDAPGQVR